MNLREIFTPAAVAAHFTEVGSNQLPYLGASLFPSRKKMGLDLAWIRGHMGLPVSLMPSAFDAKATFRDRIGITKTETEMPFFREGMKIKEKDRQELLRAEDADDPYAQVVLERVFDDAANLIAGADVVAERMRMQLLFPEDGNMGIAIRANGTDYTYNFDAEGKWKTENYIALTSTDLWTAPETSDPLAALNEAANKVKEKTGAMPEYAIMNQYTMGLMSKSDAIKNRFLTRGGLTIGYLTDAEVKNVIKDTTGLTVIVYDKRFADEDRTAKKFVPDGYVSIIPAGDLGATWYGTTPEEADLMDSPTAEVAIVNTGVAISRFIEEHPVNVNTIASEIVLPSFERMDEVAVLKVIA